MRTSMSLIDLLRAPWAILPDRLDEIQAVYATHLRGEKIDIEAIEARLGKKLSNEPPAYEMRSGGIAVLEISGPIAPKANLFTQISGGASAQALVRQIEAMGDNNSVRGAVIAWDSPGGSVHGIPTLERAIRALADKKPVVSVSVGTMASAAYWAGSAANAVYASGETDTLGSIGVVATHTYDPRGGTRQVREIVAGRYKRIASDSQPLSAEGEAYLQAQVDEIYAVFLETVAANRKVSADAVHTHMADGRVFIGRQALAAGLIDGFATAEELAERMAADPQAFARRSKAKVAQAAHSPLATAPGAAPVASVDSEPVLPAVAPPSLTEEPQMTVETIAGLTADAIAAQNPAAAEALRAQGAANERARIAAVREQAMPGHEALVERLAADGKTTGPEAAMAVLAAERAARNAQATARAADAPKPVPQDPAPADEPKGKTRADLAAEAAAYASKNGVSFLAACKALGIDR
jgi:signal peptide peptidase SppA